MSRDFVEMLSALFAAAVEFLIVGAPPERIDLLTGVSGVSFDEAWPGRLEAARRNLQVQPRRLNHR